MRSLGCIILFGLPAALLAHAHTSVLAEKTASLPQGWLYDTAASGDEPLSLSIALAQPRLNLLEEILLAAPSPHPPLSLEQLSEYQAPLHGAADRVLAWLAEKGVIEARVDGPWVRLNTTVDGARSLFEADVAYYSYNHGAPLLRAPSYTLPASLAASIDFVLPLAHFMPPQYPPEEGAQRKKRSVDYDVRRHHDRLPWKDPPLAGRVKGCLPDEITPACLRELYRWPYPDPLPAPGSSSVRLGIAGFLDQYANHNDLLEFLHDRTPELSLFTSPPGTANYSAYNLTIELVNEGINIQVPRFYAGVEANLDVQYAMALAYPVHVVYYSTGGRGPKLNDSRGRGPEQSDNEPYLALLEHLIALPDDQVPHVLSISYSDDEQSVPLPYAHRVCSLFVQLAARGTSVLVASGDGGSRGIGRSFCVSNDGSGRRALLPTFPASCPFVTAVGATIETNPTAEEEGQPAAATYSSGGFSEYFERPGWQDAAILAYIGDEMHGGQQAASHPLVDSKRDMYNANGRGIPDISVAGSGFEVLWGGVWTVADGTSASTPVVAAMVALADDARLKAGKPPLGWLNPVLYSNFGLDAPVLQDVEDGRSMSCPFSRLESEPGWPAMPGWDAVTGLGVPSHFGKFVSALINV